MLIKVREIPYIYMEEEGLWRGRGYGGGGAMEEEGLWRGRGYGGGGAMEGLLVYFEGRNFSEFHEPFVNH